LTQQHSDTSKKMRILEVQTFSAVFGINRTSGESRTKYKYTTWINIEFMNIKAAGCEGRVMLCGPTACPEMCVDAARLLITRYGVCSLIHVVKLPALTGHYGSSPCSQNPLNPAPALSQCLCSYVFVSSNLVQSPSQLRNPNSITMVTRARILS